jgi:hypothetical protein
MRYCIPARTFLGVSDRSTLQPLTVPGRLSERSMIVCDLFMTRLERSGTVRDVGRSETFIMYKINGLKRSQNHVHSTFTFTLKKQKKHCMNCLLLLRKILLLRLCERKGPYNLLHSSKEKGAIQVCPRFFYKVHIR